MNTFSKRFHRRLVGLQGSDVLVETQGLGASDRGHLKDFMGRQYGRIASATLGQHGGVLHPRHLKAFLGPGSHDNWLLVAADHL